MPPFHPRSTRGALHRAPRRPAPRPVSAFVLLAATGVGAITGVVDGPVSDATSDGPGPERAAVQLASAPEPTASPAGRADGVVPEGTTVFDEDVPAVARLDPALLDSLQEAATDARAQDAVAFEVNSGWRSAKYQRQLLREATATYGSEEEAARWVATPSTSQHVSGDAVDLGRAGAAWLSANGAQYGLCTVYANEAWHFERRAGAVRDGCPAMYADPTEDPRMQA